MVNFSAKEVHELRGAPAPAPAVAVIPFADIDGLMYMGDGMFHLYKHSAHTERDLFRPGYFDTAIQKNAGQYLGSLILYTACGGSKDPAEWRTGFLRVTKVRHARGEERTEVAIVARFHKATSVGHDSEGVEQ